MRRWAPILFLDLFYSFCWNQSPLSGFSLDRFLEGSAVGFGCACNAKELLESACLGWPWCRFGVVVLVAVPGAVSCAQPVLVQGQVWLPSLAWCLLVGSAGPAQVEVQYKSCFLVV